MRLLLTIAVISIESIGWVSGDQAIVWFPTWGTHSRLTTLKNDEYLDRYVELCLDHGIHWFREPGLNREGTLPALQKIRNSGGKTIGMFRWRHTEESNPITGRLNDNLMEVFHASRATSRRFHGLVDAWELANEPDLAFVKAMPDQYAAWSKAAYLGGKSIEPNSPVIVMGGLGLPPDLYLDRIARNGALFYTDALNQHYYGHPEHFSPLIRMLRQRIEDFHTANLSPYPQFPVWVTECGFRTASEGQNDIPQLMHRRQANNIAAYTRASVTSQVDLFMIYTLQGHPAFSLFHETPNRPNLSWYAYSGLTRHKPSSSNPIERVQHPDPSPIICQWRPVSEQVTAHKVSGSYRFLPDLQQGQYSMQGDVRVYNFSDREISGRLTWEVGKEILTSLRGAAGLKWADQGASNAFDISVPAMQFIDVPLLFTSTRQGYFKTSFQLHFQSNEDLRSGSMLFFHLESPLQLEDFTTCDVRAGLPLTWAARIKRLFSHGTTLSTESFQFHFIDRPENIVETSTGHLWLAINGANVHVDPSKATRPHMNGDWKFSVTKAMQHPNQPPTLITRVPRLPQEGFLRLSSSRFFETGNIARVDLIDKASRRFTIYEWFGLQRGQLNRDVWLNLKDFHSYGWGEFRPSALNPADVREIQLRLYFTNVAEEIPFHIEFLKPKPSR